MRYYCQGCDHSFVDVPVNPFPGYCPNCGACWWATFKRGERPFEMTYPAPNGLAPNYLFGPPVPITTTSPYAPPVPRMAP
jgi:hypothetical protein